MKLKLSKKIYLQWHKSPIKKLQRNVTRIQFLIISGIFVGLTAGIAAVVLKTLVHYIHQWATADYQLPYRDVYIYALPLIGIFLTVFIVRRFFKGKIGKGVKNILYEIAQKGSFVYKDKMYSHVITSSVTVGFGGSAGLEAPILVTGSAIGSNYARNYHVNYKDRTLLLASGAAAGIAAVFNAPIAGVMFAIEILLTEFVIADFIALIIASACGALVSKIILKEEILFFFHLKQTFNYFNIPYYILLGVLSGFISLYYARITHKIEVFFDYFKTKPYQKVLIGGSILSFLCLLFPPLFGEGYESIRFLANGNINRLVENSIFSDFSNNELFLLIFIGLIVFVKVFATAITISSGGNGGNFAPSLFVGAFLGYIFSHLTNLLNWHKLPESNFTIVGMAGILSGVMYAPLTGIFLIAEITGGYDLMIPLMIVSSLSYLIVRHYEPYSMDAKQLANKGKIFTYDKEQNIITSLKTSDLIEFDNKTIQIDKNLGDLVRFIEHSNKNIFAVVNSENEFAGIILLDDIRELMFRTDLYDSIKVKQLMKIPEALIQSGDDVKIIMKKFDETGSWLLPVLEDKKYTGYISKSVLLNNYRNQLKKQIGKN